MIFAPSQRFDGSKSVFIQRQPQLTLNVSPLQKDSRVQISKHKFQEESPFFVQNEIYSDIKPI